MDAHLKALADVSMDLTAAEEALDNGAFTTARDALDRASEQLDAVRAAWPQMNAAERTVVGQTARPLRERMDAAKARLPRLVALTEVPEAERRLHLVEDPPDDEDDNVTPLGPPDPPSAA